MKPRPVRSIDLFLPERSVVLRSQPEPAQRGPTTTWHAGLVEDELRRSPPPAGRLARLFKAADERRIPLRTILVTVAVVGVTYLAAKLIYRLRDIVLLILVAGFLALLLNPIVVFVQRRLTPRRGVAVTIVTATPRRGVSRRCR